MITIGSFVAAMYDKKWYIGIVENVDQDNKDALIKFMHPHGPSPSFHWPKHENVCWIPHHHVICVVETPNLTTARGLYSISSRSRNQIEDGLVELLQ